MASDSTAKEQTHPLWKRDRQTLDAIINGEQTDLNVCELARLRIRYNGFPGARDIQSDLDKVMQRWGLTEETLFEKTRALHAQGQIYKNRDQRDDWS